MTKKPHLDKYDYTKLLDSLKLITRSFKIVIRENNKKKREFAGLLASDLIDRLYRDIKEIHEEVKHNGREYSGHLTEGRENDNQNN